MSKMEDFPVVFPVFKGFRTSEVSPELFKTPFRVFIQSLNARFCV